MKDLGQAHDLEGLQSLSKEISTVSLEVTGELRVYFTVLSERNDLWIGYSLMYRRQYEDSLPFFESAAGSSNEDTRLYAERALFQCYYRLVVQADSKRDYEKAIEYASLGLLHSSKGGKPADEASAYITLAQCFSRKGDFKAAIHNLSLADKVLDTDAVKAKTEYERGKIAEEEEEYGEAVYLYERAYSLAVDCSDYNTAYNVANRLVSLYIGQLANEENRRRWVEKSEDANSRRRRYQGRDQGPGRKWDEQAYFHFSDLYVNAMNAYHKEKDLAGADAQALAGFLFLNQCDGAPGSYYANLFSLRGSIALALQEYSRAEGLFNDAIEYYMRDLNPEYDMLINAYRNLALSQVKQDRFSDAVTSSGKALRIAVAQYPETRSDVIDTYYLIANYEGLAGMKEEAAEHYIQAARLTEENVRNAFSSLNESEREGYWSKQKGMVEEMAGFGYALGETYSDFTDAMYNAQLLSKGLLLQSSLSISDAVHSSPQLARKMEELSRMALISRSDTISLSHWKDLRDRMASLQREIVRISSDAADFMSFLDISTEDIRNSLNRKSAAIEFVRFTYHNSHYMAALILKPGEEHVRFVPLFNEAQLPEDKIWLYEDGSGYSLIWEPISKYLEDVKDVYFSVAGELNVIAIEALADSNGKLPSEKFNLYRLTSTRNILQGNTVKGKDIAIFGGVYCEKAITDDDAAAIEKWAFESSDSGDQNRKAIGATYLPWTKKEAENVLAATKAFSSMSMYYTGAMATESNFKALSGRHTRFIHIATHGLFAPSEENPMRGSALLLYGGADALDSGDNSPDNGILTAEEISAMDLRGNDLAVLSACQTGLGMITAEGVFGLQRGFKLAGTRSILMTLWPVDDRITADFMDCFYRALSSSPDAEDFRKALVVAQTSVRVSNPDPEAWSGFILLDALD